jgi:hypothetical protein
MTSEEDQFIEDYLKMMEELKSIHIKLMRKFIRKHHKILNENIEIIRAMKNKLNI